jgi:carboxymethylenebutenolidase
MSELREHDAMRCETIRIAGHGSDSIDAYLAQPLDRPSIGGVVVLHHMPGLDEHTKEVTRRFAAAGLIAICPNLYSREAPGATPEDAFAAIWARGGVDDAQVVGDVAGAASHMTRLASSNGRVAAVGFCSGGRHALLAACTTPLTAVVDCYGSFVIEPPDPKLNLNIGPISEHLDDLSCPLLGLFGADDHNPAPDEVETLARTLTAAGKQFEFHTHAGAGHAFMATNRPSYRVQAAADAWHQMFDFLGHHLVRPAA